jgi:prepilin-type N-terminal cleavage/methylation domain-containing protein
MQHLRTKLRGFTIIELLVVIVIIGLLTGLATTSYINAQKNARDNTRKTGVASVATAVESFYQTKHRFPGLVGNEGASNIPQVAQRASWAGCLALDTANGYSSVLYYSYPTTSGGSGDHLACNERSGTTGFVPSQYAPYPSWIPELGEYLNPGPVENRYQNGTGAAQTLDSPSTGAFNPQTDDVLGTGVAQAFVYRHLNGGYMVYTRLESNTTDIPLNNPMGDKPKYSNATGTGEVGVTVYSDHTFMIRK